MKRSFMDVSSNTNIGRTALGNPRPPQSHVNVAEDTSHPDILTDTDIL